MFTLSIGMKSMMMTLLMKKIKMQIFQLLLSLEKISFRLGLPRLTL